MGNEVYSGALAVGLGVLVGIALFVPSHPGDPGRTLRSELGVFRVPQVWLTLGMGAVGFGGFFAAYSYIAHAPEGNVSLDEYVNVQAWLARIENLPGFTPMPRTAAGLVK